MNSRAYLQRVTELALETGLPLDAELESAFRVAHRTARWTLAARHAKEGMLSLALSLLPVDPLVSAAALIEPRAAGAVGRRVRRVAPSFELAGPLVVPLVYVTALLVLQLVIARVLTWQVVPVLASMPAAVDRGLPLWVASAAAFGTILVIWAAAVFTLQVRSSDGLTAKVFELIRGARLLAAASELAALGTPPAVTIPRLAGSAGLSDTTVRALIGTGPLDTATCAELSRWLEDRARRRFTRIGVFLKTAGTIAAIVIGGLMLLAVYLPISSVHQMAGP